MRWTRLLENPLTLSIGSGLLYALLLPPFSLSFLAWLVLVPLLVALASATPLRGAGLGLVFGMTLCLGISWWFPGMLRGYFGVSGALSVVGLLLLGLLSIALPYSLFGFGVAWLARRSAAGPLAVGVLFAATEYVRANLGFANPFGLIGYALTETPWIQTADLLGIYGVGILVVAVNAAVAGAIRSELRGVRPGWSRAAVLGLGLGLALYAGLRLGQHFDVGDPIPVALVQGAIEHEFAADLGEREASFRRYLDLTREASATAPELVFWPEYAVPVPLDDYSPERDELLRRSWLSDTGFVVGAPHEERNVAGGPVQRLYNSAFLIEDGELSGRYDKTRLVPIAETGVFGGWIGSGSRGYAAGREPLLLEARAARIGTLLCSEGAYPNVARALVQRGAELLANPANDFWFGHAAPAAIQLQMATVRAVETRRYLVRPAATGYSAVVDPHGRSLARSDFGGEAVLAAQVHRSLTTTPYVRFGDWPLGLASLLVLVPAGRSPRRRERIGRAT